MSDNRKTKKQVKTYENIADEYCNKNRWMEIDIEQRRALEEANQNKPDAETFLQQTQDQSQRKLILSYVFFQILLGAVGDALARAVPYEILAPRPQDAKVLAACELPFYKGALCAFSLVLWQV